MDHKNSRVGSWARLNDKGTVKWAIPSKLSKFAQTTKKWVTPEWQRRACDKYFIHCHFPRDLEEDFKVTLKIPPGVPLEKADLKANQTLVYLKGARHTWKTPIYAYNEQHFKDQFTLEMSGPVWAEKDFIKAAKPKHSLSCSRELRHQHWLKQLFSEVWHHFLHWGEAWCSSAFSELLVKVAFCTS